jgi:hypothetical protein
MRREQTGGADREGTGFMALSITSQLDSKQYDGNGRRNVLRIFATALSLLHNGKLAVPLLLYFVLRIAVIFLYLSSVNEPLSSFWALFVGGFSGEDVSHYPAHLILMPTILSRLDIVLDIFASVLFQGATILLVAAAFRKRKTSLGAGFTGAARGYPHMVAVTLVVSIALLLCMNAPRLLNPALSGAAHYGIYALVLLLGLCVQALFLYAIPFILLEGRTAPGAIASSLRTAARSVVTTFLIVAVPFVFTIPTLLLGLKAEMIAYRISPDFLLINQIAGEIIYLIATYAIIGGATITLISRPQPNTGTVFERSNMKNVTEGSR